MSKGPIVFNFLPLRDFTPLSDRKRPFRLGGRTRENLMRRSVGAAVWIFNACPRAIRASPVHYCRSALFSAARFAPAPPTTVPKSSAARRSQPTSSYVRNSNRSSAGHARYRSTNTRRSSGRICRIFATATCEKAGRSTNASATPDLTWRPICAEAGARATTARMHLCSSGTRRICSPGLRPTDRNTARWRSRRRRFPTAR